MASLAACGIGRMRRTSIVDCCRLARRGSFAKSSKRIRVRGASDPFDPRSRMRVAWKTGTSYGYRDAWALGSTRRYTVGVWVGRPDGTPLPGQYGAMTALPLLFETIDSLPTAALDSAPRPPPAGVEEIEVCWPLGLPPDPAAPGLCRKKREAWTLDGNVPPTFAERDARLWNAGVERFDIDARTGQRLTAAMQRTTHAQADGTRTLARARIAVAVRRNARGGDVACARIRLRTRQPRCHRIIAHRWPRRPCNPGASVE